jgi:acetyl esterase/lipase
MNPLRRFCLRAAVILMILSALPLSGRAGQDKPAPFQPLELTIANIMKGEELVGTAPSAIQWSVDGKKLYFRWKKPGDKSAELYALTPPELMPRKITREEMLKLPPAPGSPGRFSHFMRRGFFGAETEFDRGRTRVLLQQNGGLELLDLRSGKSKTLIRTDEPVSGVRFSFDEKKVVFTCNDNLFLLSLQDGSLLQLTSFSRKKPPEALAKPGEIEQWYIDQQKVLFQEFSQGRQDFGRFGGARPRPGHVPDRKPFSLEENQNLGGLELAPDEKRVVFTISEEIPGAKPTIIPSYVTRSGYTETMNSHTKAAEVTYGLKAGIMAVATGEVTWLDYGQGDRKVFPSAVSWSPDGKTCLVSAGSEDRKDEWLFRLDPETAKTSVVENVHDAAWVGPLGLTGLLWHPSSRSIYYISEKGGYAHIYRCDPDGREKTQLTDGRFEVQDMELSADGQRLYFHSNEAHPGELQFYVMPSAGGARTRLTRGEGQNQVSISPDERWLAVISSTSNEPPDLFIQGVKPGSALKRITVSTTELFRSYPWVKPEVLSFKARDGVDVYARLFRPLAWAARRPAVIFIHGAGYLQNAHKGWSEYFREYMFHNFLAANGYLVFDVDYRGSSGYGRDFRTGIYRHMGGKDLDDIVDSARHLAKSYGAAADRIGVYGGSYGGFLTLMALFKEGDTIKAGAALRPVADWAHYHPYYTMDILNLPQKDPDAYQQSSPIYFAEGLKGALLICHGMVDTNVHFQDTVRLAQRLIELGKENWQVAFYPVEDHTFHNSSSWTDEYKRIFDLFEKNLK